MLITIDLYAQEQSRSFHISPEAIETDVAFTVVTGLEKAMSTCLFANSLNRDSTLHGHKDRMRDTVTEQKQPFSELNRAILSTVERQVSGEWWLRNGQRRKSEVPKVRLERSSDEIQCDLTTSVTLSGQQKP